ncbi:jasmonoyl--L-amino acid synthetase GH3.5-like [Typha angustifolia]|uniref:jasmonoyl--L-amino acid synthetase GH3.5-like n=1 Tax=Typha angustifolia TaxID=59011 RepID=UPI003C2B7EC2
MLEKKEFDIEKVIQEFEEVTKDAGRVQRETLKKILEENADTEYLQNFGLQGKTDPESFKACIPLVTHKDLEPYIQRIVDGDTSPVLTAKPVTSISLSSGTTQGKPKYLPFNEELVHSTMQVYRTSYALRNREFPIENGKALQFIYGSKQLITKGGLTATTATTNVYSSKQFKSTMKDISSRYCSPEEVIFGPDVHQSLYCHLLCGLIYANEVQFIFSTFAYSIVHAFRTFELVWEELCTDIREGVLSSRITVPSIRKAVSNLLSPNPDLADSIHRKCINLSNWYGVIPELWPNAKYVYGIMTGSMEPYLKKLRHYAGSLPLLSAEYGSSEGWIGINTEPRMPPEEVTFAVLPDVAYFEFIPVKGRDEEQNLDRNSSTIHYKESQPIGLTDVQVGEEYEVVFTNFAGLYRYRLGDIVRVVDFYNSTPKLKFVCRKNLLLNINIDKNTEQDLQLAVEEASKLLAAEKLELVDYTSNVDMLTDPAHYVIYWELNADANEDVLQSCCNNLDRAFLDPGYVGSRKSRSIGPLELRIIRGGTFQKILSHYLALGGALNQFKTSRCISSSNATVLQILCSNSISSFFSTAYD